MPDNQNSSSSQREMRVLEIVGCFLMFFAILLLIGVPGGETTSDRVTNLVSGLILLAIGGGMLWRGLARHKGAWLLPVVLFTSLAVVAALAAFCITSLIPGEEETVAKAEEVKEEKPEPVEEEGERSFLAEGLRRIGGAMRDVVKGISLWWVKRFTVLGFVLIAAVVWLVRRETVFEGVVDGKWWRDLRFWTVVIMATQVIIYLLLGT